MSDNKEDSKNPVPSINLGNIDFEQIVNILTLLPARGFILAVFTLIVLLASPSLLNAFSEDATKILVFYMVLVTVIFAAGVLWWSSEEYRRIKKLIRDLKINERQLRKDVRSIQRNFQDLDKLSQSSDEIIRELEVIKEELGKTTSKEEVDSEVLKRLSKIASTYADEAKKIKLSINRFSDLPSNESLISAAQNQARNDDSDFNDQIRRSRRERRQSKNQSST